MCNGHVAESKQCCKYNTGSSFYSYPKEFPDSGTLSLMNRDFTFEQVSVDPGPGRNILIVTARISCSLYV